MNYTHDQKDNIAIFELEGSLLSEADRESIKKDFVDYQDKGIVHFLIDLSNLKHINSTGLGIFISLYTRVRGKGGEMVICNPTSNISNLLSITKLNSIFTIVDDRDKGLEVLKNNA